MRVDLFRRPDTNGRFAYLAVPQGRPIPAEAVALDWEVAEKGIDLAWADESETGITAEQGEEQISEKGYAISRSTRLQPPV